MVFIVGAPGLLVEKVCGISLRGTAIALGSFACVIACVFSGIIGACLFASVRFLWSRSSNPKNPHDNAA
jgi:hypothetical protein